MSSTRERILEATEAMLRDEPEQRPSVRAVAARAGVGASTLRHHFPTQSALMDAVVQRIIATSYPDLRIRDTSLPAAERLRECLDSILAAVGHGEQARSAMWGLARTWLAPDRGAATGSGAVRINESARSRVTAWLSILEAEGSAPTGAGRRGALLLLTVLDGLALSRALPGGGLSMPDEDAVLEDAITAVLSGHS